MQVNPVVAVLDGSVVPNIFGPNFGSFSAVVGDLFRYTNATGATRNVRVIGILYEQFAQGLWVRSEEHTSELQSRLHLVCRLLLEKKKKQIHNNQSPLYNN